MILGLDVSRTQLSYLESMRQAEPPGDVATSDGYNSPR